MRKELPVGEPQRARIDPCSDRRHEPVVAFNAGKAPYAKGSHLAPFALPTSRSANVCSISQQPRVRRKCESRDLSLAPYEMAARKKVVG
jgi:hypothetical protein